MTANMAAFLAGPGTAHNLTKNLSLFYWADTGSVSSTLRIEATRRILRLWRVSPIKPAINTRPAIAAGRTIVVSPIGRNFTPAAPACKGGYPKDSPG